MSSRSNAIVQVAKRNFTINVAPIGYAERVGRRSLTTQTSRRNFSIAITGWSIWGQTDIHPFAVGGVDSTKTFGELP